VVVALVVALTVAGAVWLQGDGAGGQTAVAKPVADVKVAIATKTYTLTAGGLLRSYEVIAPVKAPPPSAPIIVFLSGIGASVASEVQRDDLVPYVTSDQAELVYPVGYGESWNAVTCCGAAYTKNVNDVAFMQALVPKVDPGGARPIDLVGFSNGARLAFRIVCDDPGLFDEYAMVKGEPTPGCFMNKPATILEVASMNDPEVPYKPGDHGSVESLPMTTLLGDLQRLDKCPVKSAALHSGQMTLTTWSGCADGTRLGFAVWPVGEHLFPRPPITNPAASQAIWSFFTQTPFAALPKLPGHLEDQPHDRAAAGGGLGGDRALVAGDDLLDHGEAEA
jgi:polyhydroxybutyrate depolymerase